MKTVKRIAAVLLAVMLMAPAAVNAAAPSVKQTNINKKKATATVTYNKKKQLPTVITVSGQKLVVGKDCIILKKKKSEGKIIIVASHYMEELSNLCDKIYSFDMGEVSNYED